MNMIQSWTHQERREYVALILGCVVGIDQDIILREDLSGNLKNKKYETVSNKRSSDFFY